MTRDVFAHVFPQFREADQQREQFISLSPYAFPLFVKPLNLST
jgi:hypothetical protein